MPSDVHSLYRKRLLRNSLHNTSPYQMDGWQSLRHQSLRLGISPFSRGILWSHQDASQEVVTLRLRREIKEHGEEYPIYRLTQFSFGPRPRDTVEDTKARAKPRSTQFRECMILQETLSEVFPAYPSMRCVSTQKSTLLRRRRRRGHR
jgi:hypothetical protein